MQFLVEKILETKVPHVRTLEEDTTMVPNDSFNGALYTPIKKDNTKNGTSAINTPVIAKETWKAKDVLSSLV